MLVVMVVVSGDSLRLAVGGMIIFRCVQVFKAYFQFLSSYF